MGGKKCPRSKDSHRELEHRNLNGKLRELADTFARRRVNIACLQETKWVGEKAKEVEGTRFKLWYTGTKKS